LGLDVGIPRNCECIRQPGCDFRMEIVDSMSGGPQKFRHAFKSRFLNATGSGPLGKTLHICRVGAQNRGLGKRGEP